MSFTDLRLQFHFRFRLKWARTTLMHRFGPVSHASFTLSFVFFLLGFNFFITIFYTPSAPLLHAPLWPGTNPRSVPFTCYLPPHLTSASTCRSSISYNVENRFTLLPGSETLQGANLGAPDCSCLGGHLVHQLSHRRPSRGRLAATRNSIAGFGCIRGKKMVCPDSQSSLGPHV